MLRVKPGTTFCRYKSKNGKNEENQKVKPGVYFYNVMTDKKAVTGKIIIL